MSIQMCNPCIIFKNLFNYDPISAPPHTDLEISKVYICDSEESKCQAISNGWTNVLITKQFINATTPKEKRNAIAYLNTFPEKVFPELAEYDIIFICDANIIDFDSDYNRFIHESIKSHDSALFITSGYYTVDNSIQKELERSLCVSRWSYDSENMKISMKDYSCVCDINSIPVVSAKYIGWNIKHSSKTKIAQWVYNEYLKHLQGNIIFSMCIPMFPDEIFHFNSGFFNTKLTEHSQNYTPDPSRAVLINCS
jgi:hypothetical protein